MAVILIFAAGCASAIHKGQLGLSDFRRIVIVGENIRPEIARFYAKEYQANIWFTPYKEGAAVHAAYSLLRSGLGATKDQRLLIGELLSLNHTVGRWEIIVPKVAEKYVLDTLKHMSKSSLSKARGMFVLTESTNHPDLEREVLRVTEGNFFVTYNLYQE